MTRFSSPVFQHLVEVCLLSHRMILPCDSIPIRPITDLPSLSPRSFTRSPIGSPFSQLFHSGPLRAYHRLCIPPSRYALLSPPSAPNQHEVKLYLLPLP